MARSNPSVGLRLTTTQACLLVGAALALIVSFLLFSNNELRVDEQLHFAQIAMFAGGSWQVHPALTMLPGFHAIVAAMAVVTRRTDLPAIRFFVFVISLLTVASFFVLAGEEQPRQATTRTLQFAFLPILFPQFFLVYTDVASLLCVVLMLLAAQRRHYAIAGVCGLVSCAIRQNNIVWVGFACLWSYVDAYGWRWIGIDRVIRTYWTFAVTAVAVAGFVVLNGGQAAIGDTRGHPLGPVHIGNIVYLAFIAFFMFLPLWCHYWRPTLARLRHPATWLILVAVFAVFWFGFTNDHPYNREQGDFFLRNGILIAATSAPLMKLLFFVPVALTLLSLPSVPQRRHIWLVYACTLMFLLPSWLIEQRYDLIPLTLFILYRNPASDVTEWLQTSLSVALSVALFVPIERGDLFL